MVFHCYSLVDASENRKQRRSNKAMEHSGIPQSELCCVTNLCLTLGSNDLLLSSYHEALLKIDFSLCPILLR